MTPEIDSLKEIINTKVAKLAIAGIAGILLIIVVALIMFREETAPFDTHVVGSGTLEVCVVESAEIEAVNFVEITAPGQEERGGRGGYGGRGGSSALRNLSQILYLVEEGARVEKGDTLVKLDITDLATERINTEEELLTAQQSFEQLLEAHRAEEISDERAIQDMLFSVENARLNLILAQYEAETVVRERELQLEIQLIDSMIVVTDIAANVIGREYESTREYNDIQEIKDDIAEIDWRIETFSVLAPFPGLVVHIKDGWPVPTSLREGDIPRPGQRMIMLPDLSEIKAKMRINDIDRSSVWVGQRGRLTLEAYPDRVYTGRITSLAQLPQDAITFQATNLKIVEAEFLLDETDDFLRPGMSANVELIADETDEVTLAPLSAIFELNDGTFVYRLENDELRLHQIDINRRNCGFAEVTAGLSEGDEILRQYPLYAGLPLGQYDEWARQDNRIARLDEHFEIIEDLGIQYDYDRFRGQTDERPASQPESGPAREISDEMIQQYLERMGQEATPENIENARQMMQQRGRGRGGGQTGGRMPGMREGMNFDRQRPGQGTQVRPDTTIKR
ncbi:efflux RND transporter periplasmic adaptor subunit [candidate division KSB1 bacterium]